MARRRWNESCKLSEDSWLSLADGKCTAAVIAVKDDDKGGESCLESRGGIEDKEGLKDGEERGGHEQARVEGERSRGCRPTREDHKH